jgi:hypothetical protein
MLQQDVIKDKEEMQILFFLIPLNPPPVGGGLRG